MRDWQRRYGRPPSSTDWSRTLARRRVGQALKRLEVRDWPSPSTVTDLYGSWAAARADALNASMSEAPVPSATPAPGHAEIGGTIDATAMEVANRAHIVDATPAAEDRTDCGMTTTTTAAVAEDGGCNDQR
jgi:hypothetical protein